MVSVRSGASTVELDEIVVEAIDALGFFHPHAAGFVSSRIARLWGADYRSFMTDGERLAPIADKPRFQIAGEVWGCLSASGRSDPAYACKATWLRVRFNVGRAGDRLNEPKWRTFCDRAQLASGYDGACAEARSRHGTTIALTRRKWGLFEEPVPLPDLPLAGCGSAWCPCRWDLSSSDA